LQKPNRRDLIYDHKVAASTPFGIQVGNGEVFVLLVTLIHLIAEVKQYSESPESAALNRS